MPCEEVYRDSAASTMKLMSQIPPKQLSLALLLSCAAAFGQYKAEPAGAPPSGLSPSISAALQPDGTKITNNGSPYLEIWLVKTKPSGPPSTESDVTLPSIPQGALIGVLRFDGQGSDRRGQTIKPGIYTLRYSNMPVNGDHQGAAPQRDFLLMTPAASDTDAKATPAFDALVKQSTQASGTPHPAVISIWKPEDNKTGFSQQGSDWVLQTKLGDTPIAIILVGTASA